MGMLRSSKGPNFWCRIGPVELLSIPHKVHAQRISAVFPGTPASVLLSWISPQNGVFTNSSRSTSFTECIDQIIDLAISPLDIAQV